MKAYWETIWTCIVLVLNGLLEGSDLILSISVHVLHVLLGDVFERNKLYFTHGMSMGIFYIMQSWVCYKLKG